MAKALTWRLAGDPAVLVRPFYAYKEGEPYYLYFDLPGNSSPNRKIK